MQNILPFDAQPFKNAYLVNVTPELARQWLAYNKINRPAKPKVVQEYVRLIESGLWKRTHQGIAFTREWMLLDGQHRLFAVIQTGKTILMIVFINEAAENYEFIDCGRNRSSLDMLRIGQRDNSLDTAHRKTLESFLAGKFCRTQGRWSSAELNIAFQKYGNSICFAVDLFRDCKDKKINDPTVRGLLARAHYHVPPERLMEFAAQLTYSDGKAGDPISTYRYCLSAWDDRRENTRREIYKRGQQTLLAFLQNRTDVYRIDVSTDQFPIPNDADIVRINV